MYGHGTDTVMAGQCAALNVRHWDHQSIRRGDTLATAGCFSPQQWYVCTLRLLGHKKFVLKNGANVKFHTGTSEVAATAYLLKGNHMQAGESQLVQIKAKAPLVAGPGDHFILRTLSPIQTIGGGMIVEGVARRLKRNRPDVHDDLQERARAIADAARFVEYCVRKAGSLASNQTDLAFRAKVPRHRLEEIVAELASEGKILSLGPSLFIHRDTAGEAGDRVVERVGDFHRQSPESPGISSAQLREACRLEKPVLDGVVALLKRDGRLVERNGRLAVAEHQATFREEDARTIESIESLFRQQAFHPPGVEELVEKTGATTDTVQRALRILREHERLVQVAEGLLFHCEAVDRAREILVDFLRQEGRLESVRFKYLLDTTRKFAIPLLDYFDKIGVTRRSGNTRYLKDPA
ncbi:MAG: SelB C-terminal domain-containing protein [Planctomycetes bacterium]|nr:SelB C-terminal domain-containing protein [Planctomycetota bacterium]